MRGVCARVIWRPCGRLSAWQPSAWIWAWSWDPLRLRDVIRRTTPALPRQNTRQGRTPRASLWRPYVTHSNALFLHESQSFLGKKSLEGPKSRSSYRGFESQSLRHSTKTFRTVWPRWASESGCFAGIFCTGESRLDGPDSPNGSGERIFLRILRTRLVGIVSRFRRKPVIFGEPVLNPSSSADTKVRRIGNLCIRLSLTAHQRLPRV